MIKTQHNPKQFPDQKPIKHIWSFFFLFSLFFFYMSCILNVFWTLPVFVKKLARLLILRRSYNSAMSLDTTQLDAFCCDRIQMDSSGLRQRDPYLDHIRTFDEWTLSLRNVTTLRDTSLNRIISVICITVDSCILIAQCQCWSRFIKGKICYHIYHHYAKNYRAVVTFRLI